METSQIINVGFKIVDTDFENNSITIRPVSTNFKKEEESYPVLSVSLATLSPDKDIEEQIIELLQPTVKAIIDSENDQFINKFKEFIEAKQNKTVSVNKEIKTNSEDSTPTTNIIFSTDSFEVIS